MGRRPPAALRGIRAWRRPGCVWCGARTVGEPEDVVLRDRVPAVIGVLWLTMCGPAVANHENALATRAALVRHCGPPRLRRGLGPLHPPAQSGRPRPLTAETMSFLAGCTLAQAGGAFYTYRHVQATGQPAPVRRARRTLSHRCDVHTSVYRLLACFGARRPKQAKGTAEQREHPSSGRERLGCPSGFPCREEGERGIRTAGQGLRAPSETMTSQTPSSRAASPSSMAGPTSSLPWSTSAYERRRKRIRTGVSNLATTLPSELLNSMIV